MPKYNQKLNVTAKGLIAIAERLEMSVETFRAVAVLMEEKDVQALSLAIDTFKSVVLQRTEAFARTVEREYLRELGKQEAIRDVSAAEEKIARRRKGQGG